MRNQLQKQTPTPIKGKKKPSRRRAILTRHGSHKSRDNLCWDPLHEYDYNIVEKHVSTESHKKKEVQYFNKHEKRKANKS